MADLDPQPPAPVTFDVIRQEDGNGTVLRIGGELDLSNVEPVQAAVDAVIGPNPDRLVVDARDLTFADSSALALLVGWASVVTQLEIHDPPPMLRAVIESMGLAQTLQMTP
jgi:anti-anti-sigma factor